MRITVFSSKRYEREFLNRHPHILQAAPEITFNFTAHRLVSSSAFMAAGCDAVCIFANDTVDEDAITALAEGGIRCILLRCAGFNQVDLEAAKKHSIVVLHVPSYAPHTVAEFAVALLLSICRKTHKAYNRTREGNFMLDGLMGLDIHGKTIGVCGMGRVGRAFAEILLVFGTKVIAYDINPSKEVEALGVEYTTLDDLLARSDVISLHCPLYKATRHLIDADAIGKMKKGVVLINTSRGQLVDMDALIDGLRRKIIGACAMDVVEGEEPLFFDDHSGEILADARIPELMSYPNVLITPHIAFCTEKAITKIWTVTVKNAVEFLRNEEGSMEGFSGEIDPKYT